MPDHRRAIRISWQAMKARCFDSTHKSYKYYGGKGISVCERWMNFENFFEDMGPSYVKGYTLDRKKTTENYCKENCQWSSRETQARRRNSTKLSYESVVEIYGLVRIGFTQEQIAKRYSIDRTTVSLIMSGKIWRLYD